MEKQTYRPYQEIGNSSLRSSNNNGESRTHVRIPPMTWRFKKLAHEQVKEGEIFIPILLHLNPIILHLFYK